MELLVVLAIIGLLAALVVGGMGRARESANRSVCVTNLRNIGIAIAQYTNEHRWRFPGPLHAGVHHTTGIWSDDTDNPSTDHRPMMWRLRNYVSYMRRGENELFFQLAVCPSAMRRGHPAANYRISPNSYQGVSMNVFGRATGDEYSSTLSMHNVERVLGRGLSKIIAVYDFDNAAANIAGIHEDGRNYLFLDGHVRWLEGTELIPLPDSY